MSNPATRTIIEELLESEAIEKYFIDDAEKPAVTINNGPFTAPDAKKGEWYTLWFGSGMAHYNYKKLKDAQAKATQILQTAKHSINVRVVDQKGNIRTLSFSPIQDKNKEGKEHEKP